MRLAESSLPVQVSEISTDGLNFVNVLIVMTDLEAPQITLHSFGRTSSPTFRNFSRALCLTAQLQLRLR